MNWLKKILSPTVEMIEKRKIQVVMLNPFIPKSKQRTNPVLVHIGFRERTYRVLKENGNLLWKAVRYFRRAT